MWLKHMEAQDRLSSESGSENDFCFIMPICRSCNRERENREDFIGINQGVRLVARTVQEGME